MTSLSEVAGLLERLRRHQQGAKVGPLVAVRDVFGRLNSKLPEFTAEAQRVEVEISPQFNVFRILRLAHKEVQTHTPFIGELLKPEGTHGQGFVFLKGFLKMAQRLGLSVPKSAPESSRWRVGIEEGVAPYGQIDIIVRCDALRYLLVIENKIRADEGQDQLSRYADWMATQRKAYDLRQMIFLTPTGRASDTIEIGRYTRLSYHEDIRDWLNKALDEVKSPTVRETVRQYIQIAEAC